MTAVTASFPSGRTDHRTWTPVCRLDQLPAERGIAALLGDVQIALVRIRAGTVHAVGNRCPRSGAMVMARGLVGSRGGRPTLAGPLYRQVFDLATGQALDGCGEVLPVYPVRLRDGRVEVGGLPAA